MKWVESTGGREAFRSTGKTGFARSMHANAGAEQRAGVWLGSQCGIGQTFVGTGDVQSVEPSTADDWTRRLTG